MRECFRCREPQRASAFNAQFAAQPAHQEKSDDLPLAENLEADVFEVSHDSSGDTRFLADLPHGRLLGGLTRLDVSFWIHPVVRLPAGFDQQELWRAAVDSIDDAASVRRGSAPILVRGIRQGELRWLA